MILCMNANAAIDKTVIIPDFQLGGIHRPETVLALAGGKGCNVARAIQCLSGHARVTGWVGGFSGRFIESELEAEGIEHDFIHVQAESRTCLSVIDSLNATFTEIYEPGNQLTEEDVLAMEQKFSALLPLARIVTISGSLPRGVPTDFYSRLIHQASAKRIPVLVDVSGNALASVLDSASIHLLKLNIKEFRDWTGQELPDLESTRKLIAELSIRYDLIMVVTLGADGALAAENGSTWLAQPPRSAILSAVGSGDSSMAAWALGILNHNPITECLKSGVAAGSANALELGAGRFQIQAYRDLFEKITLL